MFIASGIPGSERRKLYYDRYELNNRDEINNLKAAQPHAARREWRDHQRRLCQTVSHKLDGCREGNECDYCDPYCAVNASQ